MEGLKDLRKSKNITQKELALELGVDYTTIGKYENKKSEPDIKTLIFLADYFDISIDALVGHETKQIDVSLATENQKELIRLILDLDDIESQKVGAYINGMQQARKEYYRNVN
jgi:transcriptional regulator with XRE-family HTH domain